MAVKAFDTNITMKLYGNTTLFTFLVIFHDFGHLLLNFKVGEKKCSLRRTLNLGL